MAVPAASSDRHHRLGGYFRFHRAETHAGVACGGGSSDITAARRYGNRLLSGLVNLLFGTRYTDLCYGYNAFWASHLDALALDCAGFEVEAVMNVRAAAIGLRVREVPSFELPRMHGTSNLRILADGWRITKVIVREWSAHRRARRASCGTVPDSLARTGDHSAQPAAAAVAESVPS